MQVSHSSGNISGKREPESPVEGNVIVLEHIIETTLGTVLTDDSQVSWVLNCCPNEFAEVGMVHCSMGEIWMKCINCEC